VISQPSKKLPTILSRFMAMFTHARHPHAFSILGQLNTVHSFTVYTQFWFHNLAEFPKKWA
jgi:hypothetical protein